MTDNGEANDTRSFSFDLDAASEYRYISMMSPDVPPPTCLHQNRAFPAQHNVSPGSGHGFVEDRQRQSAGEGTSAVQHASIVGSLGFSSAAWGASGRGVDPKARFSPTGSCRRLAVPLAPPDEHDPASPRAGGSVGVGHADADVADEHARLVARLDREEPGPSPNGWAGEDTGFVGAMPSVGSARHSIGECKPCVFFAFECCADGEECSHCHVPHDDLKWKRTRPPKLVRMALRARTAHRLDEWLAHHKGRANRMKLSNHRTPGGKAMQQGRTPPSTLAPSTCMVAECATLGTSLARP
eukprot:CAMPEP_0176152956 /NCGR_PEP_ID=MMETSP0120_2-20121206/78125_1 /TAXON_ID=160619 /ORGANISM="Kryptoperidinium foliaceum, Strain CCMP 1326" /LENGTH=297 /DNA_ID=CAMNT_0017489983 /DNA_START=35 /DNA_END=929 /DNA_ORIENTATION=+